MLFESRAIQFDAKDMLRLVSRTFALSIEHLPSVLRESDYSRLPHVPRVRLS